MSPAARRALALAVLLSAALSAPAAAQTVAPELTADSTELASPLSPPTPSGTLPDSSRTPGGAVRRALLVPGLGQIYNGQPLKTPVVVAALGGSIAYFVVQQRRTTLYRRAALYAGCLDAPDREVCEETDLDVLLPAYVETGELAAASLRTTRDNARGSRDLAAVGVLAVYALQALDAYVGAQLLGFDVDDDLALRAEPSAEGLRVALRLRL